MLTARPGPVRTTVPDGLWPDEALPPAGELSPRRTLLLNEIAVAAARLAEAGVDSPRADAEQIAAHVHGVRRGELHLVPDAGFDPRFWDEMARREAREPLQHITGHAYFRYLDLEVGPGSSCPGRKPR